MADPAEHEPHGTHQTRKAAASGWIGSAPVFSQICFPSDHPRVAIIASLATYGVGYVARPVGCFFLDHWGDTHGCKSVLRAELLATGTSVRAAA